MKRTKVFGYLKNYTKEMILGPFFKLVEAAFELLVPMVMAKIIDNGVKTGDEKYIFHHFILLIVFAICGLASALLCQYIASVCAFGFGTDLRSGLYHHINTLSHAELDKIGSSSLTTRIINDCMQVQTGVNMFIRLGFRVPFILFGSLIMAFILDYKLALIFCIIVPVLGIILFLITKYTVPNFQKNQNMLDRISRMVHENLEGVRVIRAFTRQRQETEKFEKTADDYSKRVQRVQKVSALLNPVSTLIMDIGIAAVIIIGGNKINVGGTTQGTLTAFINYMTNISIILVVMAGLMVTFTKAIASAKRVQAIFDIQPSLENGNITEFKKADKTPVIEFKNVTFTYPDGGAAAIQNINFKIFNGQHIGIIGGTGSGKTTILNLISRYYDTSDGEILIDGENIKNYDIKQVRKKIGICPQGNVLFSGTIAENLRFRNSDATDEELKKALEISQAAEFVNKLPDGMDTRVNIGGSNFSGGQRQRLCIARAITGNPDILILDDSMSALDFATDLRLRRSIAENMKNTTVIIISQRATSIADSDNILVMENGKQTGFDTSDILLKTNKAYREIYNSQLEN